MKKQKNIDGLLTSLENQKGALMGKNQGKSIQYWCGLSVVGGDAAGDIWSSDESKKITPFGG